MNMRFDGRGYLPDSRDPAATPPNELYVVAREGGTPKQLTHLGVDVRSAEWRPDSGALVIVADSHQRDEYSYERADLWVVDAEGKIQRLTDDGFEYDSPAWSADGKSLVFRRRQSLGQIIQAKQNFSAAVDLYRMSAAGGKMTNLTGDWSLIPDAPVCARDAIYFGAAVGGDTQLFRVPATGGSPVQVTRGAGSLGGFSFTATFDRMAYTAVDPTHPAEVFSATIAGKDEARLSTLNDEWLKEVELIPAKRIRYPSKDGTQIEGWVIMPRASAAPPPLILAIHGGPHGAYGSHFDFEFQFLAANGYAVVYTNPRGSTGYGEKFLWATWGGWGKLDYEDVMAGVDYAVAHFPVDPKRLGVTGYSYGGFLTDWIITQTTRFSAAVTGAGISNWISDYGTADIPRTKESEFHGTPWQPESNALMRAQSPITFSGRVKTPTLFVHGEADRRVPIEEAEQMYTALKKQHVPAKFVRYPGNYHGNWPAWDMVHRYHQEVQWWDQYLQRTQWKTNAGS
jgi:dipeptidyl aminopeptidase/acylaminoacyl peptidase